VHWAAILASAMGFMDRINISLAMPVLREDLGSMLAEVQWISNAHLRLVLRRQMQARDVGGVTSATNLRRNADDT
jgi:hypothetical protein